MFELDSLQGLQDNLIVDTSEGKPAYLIAIGSKPIYLRLSATSYYLLQQRSQGASFESIAHTFCKSNHVTSPEEIETAYNNVFSQIQEIEQRSKLAPSPYLFQLPLLSKNIVQKIANIGLFAFSKPAIYSLLVFIAIAIATLPKLDLMFSSIAPTDFWWSYLLLLGSLLMHELGHASACARYGAIPSEIGFTVYWIWPAFYTDVNNAWTLKRWQRVIVDGGGIFFQIIATVIYIFIYKVTNWSPIPLAIVMIFSSCLLNLNPFFKFDGYWIFADAFGITNLDRTKVQIIRYLFGIIRRQKVQPLPWSPLILIVLSIYTLLSFVVWIYLLTTLLVIFASALIDYPAILTNISIDLMAGISVLGTDRLQSFINLTFTLLIGGMMIIRLLQTLYFYGRNYWYRKNTQK